jgi:hypothetical protein
LGTSPTRWRRDVVLALHVNNTDWVEERLGLPQRVGEVPNCVRRSHLAREKGQWGPFEPYAIRPLVSRLRARIARAMRFANHSSSLSHARSTSTPKTVTFPATHVRVRGVFPSVTSGRPCSSQTESGRLRLRWHQPCATARPAQGHHSQGW